MKNTLYILCGMPGSGKTTYAKSLENKGTVRLTLDEELIRCFGKNFDPKNYEINEANTEQELLKKAKVLLTSGCNVALDFGFWKKEKRDRYKAIAISLDADWKLIYFESSVEELKKRLRKRNSQKKSEAQIVTTEMLENFINQFEIPHNEGEIIIKTTK